MNHFPSKKDFLAFVEGELRGQLAREEQMLRLLGSNPQLRQEFAEIKKDLYLIDSQIPIYLVTPEFRKKMQVLVENWINMHTRKRRKFRLFDFLRNRI